MIPTSLTPALASRFASIALGHVTREYPNLIHHVLAGPEDVQAPRALHPIFYGSLDWHSCVHGYWTLARVLRRHPELPEAARIRALFDDAFTVPNVAGELAYLASPLRATFERPYGWAWLLALQAELLRHEGEDAARWRDALAPLAAAFAARFTAFLPKAAYPVRAGTHFNTAFGIALALEYADAADPRLASLLRGRAAAWYADDAGCQAWEPGGDDFLSPALIEAECMRRVLSPATFAAWFGRFLPDVERRLPATLFQPAGVSDRSDGKIAHLDGLNLSRAWCWRSIAGSLGSDDPRSALALDAAERHLAAALPHVSGEYMGEHWLATFALLALEA